MMFLGHFQTHLLRFFYSMLWHWSHIQGYKICICIGLLRPVSTYFNQRVLNVSLGRSQPKLNSHKSSSN